MSEAKARELLAALVEAWDSEILAGRFLRLNDAFHAARAYLAAAPAPPAEPTPDPDCVCRGNWRTLVKEYGPLIGKRFRDLHTGEVYMFYGLVHSDDDFYYGLSGGKEGKSRLDSCVGSLKHFYEQVDDAAPAAEPVAQQPQPLDWAVERWTAEVSGRPLVNKHRRTLDDVWRQVIRRLGGDDVLLCGPRHDALLATPDSAAPTQPTAGAKEQG